MNNIREFRAVVSAGVDVTIPLQGNFIYVFSSLANFTIVFDEGNEQSARAGSRFSVGEFKAIRIESIYDQTIILKYGYGDYSESAANPTVAVSGSVSSKPTSSTLPGNTDVVIPNGTTTLIIPARARTRANLQRVDSNTGVCRVWGASVCATCGIQMPPNGLMSLETSGAVFCYNDSGADVVFGIGEEI